MTTKTAYPLSKEGLLYMKMLAKRCGIDLTDYRRQAIYNRLIKRLRLLNIQDFDSYCNLLRIDLEEEFIFINIITNLTTYFFRESYHFEYLEKILLPELIAKQNKIRIWSAGCSTGEEPYSIAMVLLENIPKIQKYDIKILATDINSDALRTAEQGSYDLDSVHKISSFRQQAWFQKDVDNSKMVNINSDLKQLITFKWLNLVDLWPMHGPFDIIFCRNVTIYFKNEISRQILARFNNLLEVNGALFLGHSETLHETREHYHTVGNSIYKKIR
jgi:chemotaxis protein methyltransferase CheR